jgi:S1-C subfamily serine protease
MSQTAQELIQEVARSVGPAVVGLGRGARGGSGVVVAPGRVLTLARNLRGDEVNLSVGDGPDNVARVLGTDADLDLAVLSAETAGVAPVEWAPDEPVAIGTSVLALADPGGRGLRVTAGHVSSAGRRFRGPRGRLIADVIEHTAPLPRGSGGGPLVNAAGLLIGLNAVRLDGGLILALPAAALRERVESIASGQTTRPRRLGLAIVPPRAARRMRRAVGLPERNGLLVRGIEQGSPAAAAGVQRGDLIVAAGDRELSDIDDLYGALDTAGEGSVLVLRALRGTEELELQVTLAGPDAEAA